MVAVSCGEDGDATILANLSLTMKRNSILPRLCYFGYALKPFFTVTTMLTINSVATLSSGHTIPRLGFGVYRNVGDSCFDSVLAALKLGYRHIDSAQMYGNEDVVGAALLESGLPRQAVFITTKIENKDYGYESTLKAVDESLGRLKTDYIDLFLIHEPYGGPEKRRATYRALLHAKKEGKIRSVGVSNFSAKHIQELLDVGLEKPSVNQIELHPFCQMKHVVPYCLDNGILIEAFCPIVRGTQNNDPVIQKLAEKYKKEPAQILIRWSLQKGYIPLPKSSHRDRIRGNADVYDFNLAEEDMNALNELDKGQDGSISWWPYDEE